MGMTGALALPGFGTKVAAKPRVDYENTLEGALVRRAQSGDETAFREIVDRYQSKVFSIIHGIVRQRNDVEDIAQQVFCEGLPVPEELRFPQLPHHLDLQNYRQRVLRLPPQAQSAEAGL